MRPNSSRVRSENLLRLTLYTTRASFLLKSLMYLVLALAFSPSLRLVDYEAVPRPRRRRIGSVQCRH